MARTIAQIYTNLVNEKNTYSNLSTLAPTSDDLPTLLQDIGSTPSTVGVWRLWVYLFAFCTWTLETLWDAFMALVQTIIAQQQVPTLAWYQTISFAFQYGDPLVQVNGQFVYNPVNAANQIITRCSASENGGVRIKVAKTVGGALAQLSAPELAAFNSYIGRRKPAGVNVVGVSFAADLLLIPATVWFDPMVLDATGQSIATPGTYPVEDAINAYIALISGVNNPEQFNGIFNLAKLEDAIQAATGVVDVALGNVQWKYGALAYATVVRQQALNAGYCTVDPANTLRSTITYQPNV